MQETQTESTAPKAEIPDWAKQTPDEITYQMEMTEWCTGNNEDVQQIELTRAEFINLKGRLARLRGFEVEDEEPEAAVAPKPEAKPSSDLSEELETVRLIYERDAGCITPGEEMITNLIGFYKTHGRIDLHRAEVEMENFRENWNIAVKSGIILREQYPELITEPAAAGD